MFLVGFMLYIRSIVLYVCFVGHCLSFYLLNLLNGTEQWFPELAPLGATSSDSPIMSISGICMSLRFHPEISALWSE